MILTRRISQIVFLLLVLALLALTVGRPDMTGTGDLKVSSPLAVDAFLRLDPAFRAPLLRPFLLPLFW